MKSGERADIERELAGSRLWNAGCEMRHPAYTADIDGNKHLAA
jgi:hypothetical protein